MEIHTAAVPFRGGEAGNRRSLTLTAIKASASASSEHLWSVDRREGAMEGDDGGANARK